MATGSYDPKCFDLAKAFLEDEPLLNTPDHHLELATIIQSAIEDWIESESAALAAAEGKGG